MLILSKGIGNYLLPGQGRYSFFAGNTYPGLAGHSAISVCRAGCTDIINIKLIQSDEVPGSGIRKK